MMLQKKTKLGTLVAKYNQNETYPGFWVDLRQINSKEIVPLCNVEYNPDDNCIQVAVYKDSTSDEPTDIIKIDV